jgi:hypothetical protein
VVRSLGADDERLLRRLNDAVASLDVHLGLGPNGRQRPLGPGDARRFLDRPDARCLVATEDDAPVGVVVVQEIARRAGEPIELLVHEVAFRAERQDEIGTALAGAIRRLASDRGTRRVHVAVGTDDAEKLGPLRALGRRRETGDTILRFDLGD